MTTDSVVWRVEIDLRSGRAVVQHGPICYLDDTLAMFDTEQEARAFADSIAECELAADADVED